MADVGRNRSPEINFGQLLYRLNEPQRKLVRDLEKSIRKMVQSSYGRMFNRTCLDIYIYIFICKKYLVLVGTESKCFDNPNKTTSMSIDYQIVLHCLEGE